MFEMFELIYAAKTLRKLAQDLGFSQAARWAPIGNEALEDLHPSTPVAFLREGDREYIVEAGEYLEYLAELA